MNNFGIVAALMLCVAVAAVPTTSAVPAGTDCLGDYSRDAGGKWEVCWGVHYNDAGQIDCIGQYLWESTHGENCVGVRP